MKSYVDELIEEARINEFTKLDFSGTELHKLPESIGQLTQLQVLRLHVTHLESLPECIGKLTNLEILSLAKNQLTSLPECITQLTQLKELDVSYNRLTSLPDSLYELLIRNQAIIFADYKVKDIEYKIYKCRALSKTNDELKRSIKTYSKTINYTKTLHLINKLLGTNYTNLALAVKEKEQERIVQDTLKIIDYQTRTHLEAHSIIIDNARTDVQVNKYKIWM